MKFLRALCVLAVALCLAGSVYAETQSVKVSGDLTMRGFFRNAYDYQGSPQERDPRVGIRGSQQSWWMSTAELEVDADLTDNVQTVIRLVNQRDWNVAMAKSVTYDTTLYPNGRGGYTENADEFNVMVDLAYVTLKDFIYSPLTLTIGRQDLWFGKGFIVGANLQNPGVETNTITGNLSAPEYTAIWSFDAIKAVLDYDPWTITGIYSNVFGNTIQGQDGVNLWGLNAGYKFDAYKAEAEAYWFYKNDRSVDIFGAVKNNTNDVHTFGGRGSFDPLDVLTIALEGAYQGGQYIGSRLQTASRGRSAWALDASAEWRYFMDRFSWKPKLGCEFVYYSGNKPEDNAKNASGAYKAWDPMYRGKFDSAIREFVGKFYFSSRYAPNTTDNNKVISADDASFRNQYQMIFLGSIQPIESLTLKANYNLFWNQFDFIATNNKSGGFIGHEIDLTAN